MAGVLNITTFEFKSSVDTIREGYEDSAGVMKEGWVKNPDMSQVVGVPVKYWKWDSEASRPIRMTEDEITAVDVSLNSLKREFPKNKLEIIHDILSSCTSTEQARRLILAVRKYPDFLLYLDDKNWDGAKGVIMESLEAGDILEEDCVLVILQIPN